MSSTTESKPNKQIRASTFDVSPSVRRFIADSEGNLDEKAAVAALSQTHNTNKYLWTGSCVLIGVVFLLIAANIGISVAVARLTRQLNVDPVTGMAIIPGSDNVVMKTSTALYIDEDVSVHTVSVDFLLALKTIELNDGNISFDVKGFARMSDETIFLVEGGSLIFDINGLKNVTGDEPTRMFSSDVEDKKSIDIDGRKLSECPYEKGTGDRELRCGPNQVEFSEPIDRACPENKPYCDEASGWCGPSSSQSSTEYDYCAASQNKVTTRSAENQDK